MTSFVSLLQSVQKQVDEELHKVLTSLVDQETSLLEAIKYSALNGGKRIRAFLCLAFGEALEVPPSQTLRVACAIELLHSYSLIHDDLPAMDDSNLRRGKASCHIRFNEATAILSGDAMLAFAFEILSSTEIHPDPEIRCTLVNLLAKAGGPQGMALGQMMDIEGEKKSLTLTHLRKLHKLKTSRLIEFSCISPAILKKADSPTVQKIQNYAEKIGVLFQIVDDILDAEGSVSALGKPTAQDKGLNKTTFVTLLGLEEAKNEAEKLYSSALADLEALSISSESLKQVTYFILNRAI